MPVSCGGTTWLESDQKTLYPLYFGGLWLAVIITPAAQPRRRIEAASIGTGQSAEREGAESIAGQNRRGCSAKNRSSSVSYPITTPASCADETLSLEGSQPVPGLPPPVYAGSSVCSGTHDPPHPPVKASRVWNRSWSSCSFPASTRLVISRLVPSSKGGVCHASIARCISAEIMFFCSMSCLMPDCPFAALIVHRIRGVEPHLCGPSSLLEYPAFTLLFIPQMKNLATWELTRSRPCPSRFPGRIDSGQGS